MSPATLWNRLSRRERLLIIASSCVLVVASLVTHAWPAWSEWHANERDRVYAAQLLESQTRSTLAGFPKLVESLGQSTERFIEHAPLFLVESTTEAAIAALGGLVSEAATVRALRLESTELMADTLAVADTRVIQARLRGAGDSRGLARFLADLEAMNPLVRVAEASIAQPGATSGVDVPEELAFDLTLEVLHLQHEKESK